MTKDDEKSQKLSRPLLPVAASSTGVGRQHLNSGTQSNRQTATSSSSSGSSSSSSSSSSSGPMVQLNLNDLKRLLDRHGSQRKSFDKKEKRSDNKTKKPQPSGLDKGFANLERVLAEIHAGKSGTKVAVHGLTVPSSTASSSKTTVTEALDAHCSGDGWKVAGTRRNRLISKKAMPIEDKKTDGVVTPPKIDGEGLNPFNAAVMVRCRNTRPTFKDVIVNGSSFTDIDKALKARYEKAMRIFRDQSAINRRAARLQTLKGRCVKHDYESSSVKLKTVYRIMIEVCIWIVENATDSSHTENFKLSLEEFFVMRDPYSSMWEEIQDMAICIKIQMSRAESNAQTEQMPAEMRAVKVGINIYNKMLESIRKGFKEAEDDALTGLKDLQQIYNEMIAGGAKNCGSIYNYHMQESDILQRLSTEQPADIVAEIMGKISVPEFSIEQVLNAMADDDSSDDVKGPYKESFLDDTDTEQSKETKPAEAGSAEPSSSESGAA